jgi:BASS family bile acid:Na+ symporter
MKSICRFIEKNFHLLILIFALAGFLEPDLFAWLGSYVKEIIGGIMFCMGATLTFSDFRKVVKTPKPIFLGLALQYTFMPPWPGSSPLPYNSPRNNLSGCLLWDAAPVERLPISLPTWPKAMSHCL